MAFTAYHNILGSNGADQSLVEKVGPDGNNSPGGIRSVTLTNVHTADATVDLYFFNDLSFEKFYFIKSLIIPPNSTQVLSISDFNNNLFSLEMTVGTSDKVDVILGR